MKISAITGYNNTQIKKNNFGAKLPAYTFETVNRFVGMENNFVDAEMDLVMALAKKNPKLHAILKSRGIEKYNVPFLKTLLIHPVFDEKVLGEVPHMFSIKWPREVDNRFCAQGRQKIAELYAANPVLNQNKNMQNRIGEILTNCTTGENANYVEKFLKKYLSHWLIYEDEKLSKALPDMIVKLQDNLYDSRIDAKGLSEEYNKILQCHII